MVSDHFDGYPHLHWNFFSTCSDGGAIAIGAEFSLVDWYFGFFGIDLDSKSFASSSSRISMTLTCFDLLLM